MPRLRRQLYVSAVLIGGCTLTAVILGQIFLPRILDLIQTPAELMGDAVAYLIAPPLEAMFALDGALKASDVRLAKLYPPPSETNFAGALLTGSRSACAAACSAFAEAVRQVAQRPVE